MRAIGGIDPPDATEAPLAARSVACRVALLLAMLLLVTATTLRAQQPGDSTITVSPSFKSTDSVAAQAPIALTLSRMPTPSEGRIAVVVGSEDLTSLFNAAGTRLVFRANGVNLPAGDVELTVFLVKGDEWTALATLPLHIRAPLVIKPAKILPRIDLRNVGQLAQGRSGTTPAPDRPTFQTLNGTVGLTTSQLRDGFTLTSDTHVFGADEQRKALRYREQGDRASRIDLADYAMRFAGRQTKVALGHVSAGSNRHLINNFASRGLTATVGGARATWTVAAQNGTSIVGTDNIVGLNRGDHRVVSSGLAVEMIPGRPGALHVDATVLNSSILAEQGYTQGAILSAERSDGYGLQFAAKIPSERLRVAAGLASSRSGFTDDTPPTSGGVLVSSKRNRKAAQYAEVGIALMREQKLLGAWPATLDLSLKHERVDPMFRSVASIARADIESDNVELSGNVGQVRLTISGNRTSDNLDAIASVLTTRMRSSSIVLAAPLAPLLRVDGSTMWLPTLSYSRQQQHPFGAGTPADGGFTASDVPDQLNVQQSLDAQWQLKRLQLGYHVDQSSEDNRQPGFELADITTRTHRVTAGGPVGSSLRLALDLGVERQEFKELAQLARFRKAGVTGNWQMTPFTRLDGSITLNRTNDTRIGSNTHVSTLLLGLARDIRLWHSTDGIRRGQLWLCFTRQANDVYDLANPFSPPAQSAGWWRLASGLTLRLL